MSTGRPPPSGIPTLTEVVPWPEAGEAAERKPERAVAAAPVPAATPVKVAVAASRPAAAVAATPPATANAAPAPAVVVVPPAAAAARLPSEADLTKKVLADLQGQLDLMLEVRLREVLAPILARASDSLIRDARKELTATLADAVARSVARELGKLGGR